MSSGREYDGDPAAGSGRMRSPTRLPFELTFEASPETRAALAALGRTEDVRFAPSGRRLALACYARGRIALADIELETVSSRPQVAVAAVSELASPTLREPHGVDFVDDETLVVGDRAGGVTVLGLPPPGTDGGVTTIAHVAGADGLVDGPGSVAVSRNEAGGVEIFTCNNWANTVTRYALGPDGAVGDGEVVVRKRLDLPDGLALSRDGRWLAVSNHNSHCVLLYALSSADADAEPIGMLRGPRYPHGLRFDSSDGRLVVADAGAPHVHVFAAPDGDWSGVRYPARTLDVVDEETFARGHHNAEEGGPKGLDLDGRAGVLVVTSELVPLAFFELGAGLDRGAGPSRDAMMRYELEALSDVDQARAAAAEMRDLVAEIQRTKAWRLIQPVRRVYGVVGRRR